MRRELYEIQLTIEKKNENKIFVNLKGNFGDTGWRNIITKNSLVNYFSSQNVLCISTIKCIEIGQLKEIELIMETKSGIKKRRSLDWKSQSYRI